MKRIFTFASLIFAFTFSSFAQGEMDAFNLSYGDLTGTARSVAMGGAFGALGGDISGIAINPAGIGVYKSYEIVTTMNFTNTKSKATLGGVKSDDNKFKFVFDNIAFVGVVPLNSDEVPLINFGFSYNKLKSFNRKVSMRGSFYDNIGKNTLTSYIANRAYGISENELMPSGKPFRNGSDYWYGAFGVQTGLIKPSGDGYVSTLFDTPDSSLDNDLLIREKGDISSYDFNVGTTISEIVSIGATISVTDINYQMSSSYSEYWFQGDSKDAYRDYFFDNFLRTEGTGWQVKTGVIVKPVNELRIGVSYHSPTWYNMTDYYSAYIDSRNGNETIVVNSWDEVGESATPYKFRTPDKWVFSLAGIIGQRAILSADYELTNYSKMYYKEDAGLREQYDVVNNDIDMDFRNSSVLRLGAEVRITPQFSGRVGYMWQQSPVKDILKNGSANPSPTNPHTAATAGTVSHYSLVGDAHYITYGLGYRFTPNFYTDIAFVMKSRKDDLYSFGGADRAELKTNTFTGLLTLGCKF